MFFEQDSYNNKTIPQTDLFSGQRRIQNSHFQRKRAHVATPRIKSIIAHLCRRWSRGPPVGQSLRGPGVFSAAEPTDQWTELALDQNKSSFASARFYQSGKRSVHRKKPAFTAEQTSMRGCAVYGCISACILMSTRLRTFSLRLPHGGDRWRARSEPRGSVRGADADAACCLRRISACGRASRTQRARSHICASPCVTNRGRAAADGDGVGLKRLCRRARSQVWEARVRGGPLCTVVTWL